MKKKFILILSSLLVFGSVSPSMVTQAEELASTYGHHEMMENLDVTIETINNTTIVTVVDTITSEKTVATYNSDNETFTLNNEIVDLESLSQDLTRTNNALLPDADNSIRGVDPGAGYETDKTLIKITSGTMTVKGQDEAGLISTIIIAFNVPLGIATVFAAYLYNKLPEGKSYWSWYRWEYPDPHFPLLFKERLNEVYFYSDSSRKKLIDTYRFTGNFG